MSDTELATTWGSASFSFWDEGTDCRSQCSHWLRNDRLSTIPQRIYSVASSSAFACHSETSPQTGRGNPPLPSLPVIARASPKRTMRSPRRRRGDPHPPSLKKGTFFRPHFLFFFGHFIKKEEKTAAAGEKRRKSSWVPPNKCGVSQERLSSQAALLHFGRRTHGLSQRNKSLLLTVVRCSCKSACHSEAIAAALAVGIRNPRPTKSKPNEMASIWRGGATK